MYAIIKAGGKQYRVEENNIIEVDRLPGEPGAKVTFGEVLAVGERGALKFGAPLVENASVEGEIVRHFRGPKLIAFKMKRRKGYKKTIGHRQELTKVKITQLKP